VQGSRTAACSGGNLGSFDFLGRSPSSAPPAVATHTRQVLRPDPRAISRNGDRLLQCCGAATGEEATAELAAIPDSPHLKAADEAIVTADYSNADYRSCEFKAKIERIAEQYRGGQRQLDLANASPAELLAFCVAVEMDAWR
jgi:hypothetical protein